MFRDHQAHQTGEHGQDFHKKGITDPLMARKPFVYNPYDSPPNFKAAIKHGLAKRVHSLASNAEREQQARYICPCCGFSSKGKPIPIQAELSELYFLGSGYALYFKTMKYSIAILILMFATSGLYNLISNAATEDCTPQSLANDVPFYCLQNYISTFAISNKKDDEKLLTAQMALNLVSIILMIPCFQYIRYQLRKTHIDADDTTVTPSDYTVQITGVNPNLTDQEIKEWIEKFGTSEKPIVCYKINRTYNIGEYVALKKKLDSVETAHVKETEKHKLEVLEQEANQLKTQLNDLKEKGLTRTHTVFLTFEKATHTADILEYFNKSMKWSWKNSLRKSLFKEFSEMNGKKVIIERAPEPTDVIWENLNENPWQTFKKRTATNVGAAILIVICFALIIIVNWAQGKIIDETSEGSRLPQILSAVGSVLIYLINTLLSFAIRFLVARENHGNYTSYLAGTCGKLFVAQLINTGFTTILAKIALYNTFDQGNNLQDGIEKVNFYGKQGLIENMFYVFISNAFLTPALGIFDPFYFLRLYQRKKALEKGESNKMTQQEAHQLYEQPEMDLAVKNALLLKTMLLTAFFAPAIPFAFIFSILGLITNYWVDKYLLLRRNVYPKAIQNRLCIDTIQQLEWMGFVFGIGNLFFVATLQGADGVHIYDVVPKSLVYLIIGLSLLYVLLPNNYFNKRIFKIVDDVTEEETYANARLGFPTDYDIQNPVTSQEGLEDFLKLVKSKRGKEWKMKNNNQQRALDRTAKMFAMMGVKMIVPEAEHEPETTEDNNNTKVEKQETIKKQDSIKKDFSMLDDYASNFAKFLLPTIQGIQRQRADNISEAPAETEVLDAEDKENNSL